VSCSLLVYFRHTVKYGNGVVGLLESIGSVGLYPVDRVWMATDQNTIQVFLAMDFSGAFFSLMALVAQNTFDVLGGVAYIVWYV
jgi:hypothetical protein